MFATFGWAMVTFGKATRDDLRAIVDLLRDDDLGRTRESADLADYEKAYDEIAADPNQYLIVGRREGEVVATLQLSLIPNLARAGTKRAQIESVRVARTERGRGVGKKMIEWAIELARSEGAGLVQLTTDKRRPAALVFYESIGFDPSHEGFKLHL